MSYRLQPPKATQLEQYKYNQSNVALKMWDPRIEDPGYLCGKFCKFLVRQIERGKMLSGHGD